MVKTNAKKAAKYTMVNVNYLQNMQEHWVCMRSSAWLLLNCTYFLVHLRGCITLSATGKESTSGRVNEDFGNKEEKE